MLRGMAPLMEKHFGVRLFDEAISRRCVCRPAISVVGNCLTRPSACSIPPAPRWRWAKSATPARIEDARKRLDRLTAEEQVLRRELSTGAKHGARLDELAQERQTIEASLKADEERWAFEQQLVTDIRALREQIESPGWAATPTVSCWRRQANRVECFARRAPLVPCRWTAMWSPKSSPRGPAFPWARWSG